MEYAYLGRTALKVSRFCLGTMNFGSHTSEADSFRVMDRALEHGINFFDTANVYGGKRGEGVTEQIIGRWLAKGGGRRDKVVLATKVLAWLLANPVVTAPIVGPRTLEQLDESLRALEVSLDPAALKRLDEIFPGPGGAAPEAYAW